MTSAVVAVVLATLTSTSPGDVERRGLLHVVREFERIGRTAPVVDSILTEAARQLARDAMQSGADDAADLLAIAQEVSVAGGFDPTPRAVVVRATPADYALETFLKRKDYNDAPATHVGVGVYKENDRAVVVALLSERKARLEPFPRAFEGAGRSQLLCGELSASLRSAEVFVTRPGGDVDRIPLTHDRGRKFCAHVDFPQSGRHTVEVVGRGGRGPEVAALFFVDAGGGAGQPRREKIAEPATVDAARAELVVRINGLREAHGLPPVALDEKLNAIAQAHSDRMAAEHFFAHVASDGEDLRRRLSKAGYPYARAGENLGLAAGPLAAHFAIEHSPGHRRNLLDREFTAVGLGVAFEVQDGRRQALLTQVLVKPITPPADPIAEAYRILTQRRASLGLTPLKRNPVLEGIATDHARRALKLDQPRIALPGASVHERVFGALTDVKTASVDFYVADDPSAVPESKSVGDRKNDLVGIGAVRGDSPTYGPAKYWVVVIYAASQ